MKKQKKGFTIEFNATYTNPEYGSYILALEKVISNGDELKLNKDYTVKYGEDVIFGNKFEVTINSNKAKGNLEFVLNFKIEEQFPIESKCVSAIEEVSVYCNPPLAGFLGGWFGEVGIERIAGIKGIQIVRINFLYGNLDEDQHEHHLTSADWTLETEGFGEKSESRINKFGLAYFLSYWAKFDSIKIQLEWEND